jgi:predicted secreted protein
MRRPYIAEAAIAPGRAVVQGSADNKVTAPGAAGSGDFIGVYPFEANLPKAAEDEIGVALSGVAKVEAGGSVAAGKKAVINDESGTFANAPDGAGQYATVGTFLESGTAGEYVDMIVERGSVTIPAEE